MKVRLEVEEERFVQVFLPMGEEPLFSYKMLGKRGYPLIMFEDDDGYAPLPGIFPHQKELLRAGMELLGLTFEGIEKNV